MILSDITRTAFNKLKNVIYSSKLNIKIETKILFSVLLYGVEAWTLTETIEKRIESLEIMNIL